MANSFAFVPTVPFSCQQSLSIHWKEIKALLQSNTQQQLYGVPTSRFVLAANELVSYRVSQRIYTDFTPN